MPNINLDPLSLSEGYPPVEKWSPPFCGDMDLVIKANGDWMHEGGLIKRDKMVTLFSRILWREGDEYFLVTPGEKVRIRVEDAPFQITQYEWQVGEDGKRVLQFLTRTNDLLRLGEGCELKLFEIEGEFWPYVSVRYGMWASFHRNVFYQLVNEADLTDGMLCLESAGKQHVLGELAED